MRPDIVFPRRRIAVFVDGCYWHRCPVHSKPPQRNLEYWVPKFQRTVERDQLDSQALRESGWTVLRFWEHESVEEAAATVVEVWRSAC